MTDQKWYTVDVPFQARAMIQELVRIGVHGYTAEQVLIQLALDQLKELCGTPGFGPSLYRASEDARTREETQRREARDRRREARDRKHGSPQVAYGGPCGEPNDAGL